MLGFNFGGSKASSQSSSLDVGFNTATSFSDSLAQSLSRSQGTSFGTQSVWNADVLQKLYADAIGAAGNTNTDLFSGQVAQLYDSGASFLDRLGVGAGEDYLQSRLTDTSARDSQLDVLGSRMGELFREELNPAITARHVAGGTLGGGRQGVAQGQAAQRVAREYAAGASDIISRDQLARDSAAGTLMAGRTQAAGVGLSALPGLSSVAEAGLGAPLSPYATLSSIIGGPTVLTESGSQDFSEATSESVARAISEALGFNYGTSQSTSKSKSFNFGVGA